MEILEGKQNGSLLYIYHNYTYCKDNRFNYIYRCSKRRTEKCSAVLREEGESYSLEVLHNHPDEPYIKEISEMKKEMIRLCKETTQSFKVIFDTVCRTNLLAGAHISYSSMKSIFSRERAKSRPKIPIDLRSLHQQLEIYEPTRSIYRGCATSTDNKIALIFSNDILLKLLSEASEIFVDGTFSGIAVVFVLCEVRSASLYKAMWEKIILLAPGLSENLKFIMADYEKAALKIINQQFPAASIHGCWFHYSQALYRKWRRLQLNSAPRELLSMAISMALAPSSLFLDSLNIMQNIADRLSATYPNVLLFMAYLRSTWLPIASKVSVHNCPVRTNNLVESFHHIANQKVGTNPNLWVFLENLSEIITSQEMDYSRLRNNVRVRRARTQFNKERNIQIKEGQNALINGDISLEHFLRMFSRFNQHYQQPESLSEANDNEEIDASLLSDRIPESAESTYTQSFIQRRCRSRNSLPRQEEVSLSIESSANDNEEMDASVLSDRIPDSAETTYTQNFNQRRHSHNSLPRQEEIPLSIESSANDNEEMDASVLSDRIPESAETTYTQSFNQRRRRSHNSSPRQEEVLFIESSDEEIYRIPDDDYSFSDDSLTSPEITFYQINDVQKIIDDNKEPRSAGTCIICLSETASYIFVPCGHLCACNSCSNNLVHKRCPMCNIPYDNCIKTILS